MKFLVVLLFSALVMVSAQVRADASLHSATVTIHSESEVFAVRGEAVVTQADFDVFLQRLPAHHRPEYLADPERIGQALDRLMLPRQLAQKAKRADWVEDPLVQAQLLQMVTVFLADEYLERHWQEVRLDDYSQQALELYLTRPDLIRPTRKVDFTHVLIRSGAERGDLDAMRAILAIYDELQEGAGLSELAVRYSEDPSVTENQGRFEGVAISALEERVGHMAQFLDPGQISEPFRSSFGWHVLELHARYRPEVGSFEDVRERALEVAERRHRTAWREALLASLNTLDIEIAEGAVAKLLDRYPATEEDVAELSRDVLRRMGLD